MWNYGIAEPFEEVYEDVCKPGDEIYNVHIQEFGVVLF